MTAPAPVALPHPLVDESGPGWVATFTRAPIVGVSSGRSALFVDAAGAGVRVVLVTERTARLTYPLFQLLRNTGGLWLTRAADGVLRHAASGTEVESLAAAADPRSVSTGSDPLLAPPQSAVVVAATSAWVQFAVSTHHAARTEATVGGTLEMIVDGMTEGSTAVWGSVEPVSQRWDRVAISGLARARMPADTRVLVAGDGGAPWRATIRVARSSIGITEETRAVFAVPDAAASGTEETASLLERIADRQQVLLGTAWSLRGPSDTTIPAERQLLPQPIAAVIGPRGVRTLGLVPTSSGIPGARSAGNRRTPSLVVTFGGDRTTWRGFAETVERIGLTEITSALYPGDIIDGGGRHAS